MITGIWVNAQQGVIVVEQDDDSLRTLDGDGVVEELDDFEEHAYQPVWPPDAEVFGWTEVLDAAMDRIVGDALLSMAMTIAKNCGDTPSKADVLQLIRAEARQHISKIEPKFWAAVQKLVHRASEEES